MFNRIAKIIIPNIDIEINGLKIQFEIQKSLVGYPNLGNIEIYNLSQNTRALIEEKGLEIQLYAGYSDEEIGLIFDGNITNVIHKKSQTDWQTSIFAQDGIKILNSATINTTFAAGTTMPQIYDALVDQMDGITKGITKGLKNCLSGKRSLLRELQLSGNVKDWLDKLSKDCGFEYSVNNGIIETTPTNLPLSDESPVIINQNSGMIGSPQRTEIGVEVANLLLPKLKLGRTIKIEAVNTEINIGNLIFRKITNIPQPGTYRIDKITHIGDTHGNDWKSQIYARGF